MTQPTEDEQRAYTRQLFGTPEPTAELEAAPDPRVGNVVSAEGNSPEHHDAQAEAKLYASALFNASY